ncbi:Uma2 family endonuclease [Streptosporangium sp. KLBMP 9127]|nr:Uma2 family endonuclease [Streptosporangium sp. KLBMP 9127]
MVTTSRRPHARSASAPEPESAPTAEPTPSPQGEQELTTLREIYDSLVGRTKLRAEIINGRLIVSPVGTPEHQRAAARLLRTLYDHVERRGWDAFAGLDVCMDGSRDPYEPDLVVAPPDAPRWGGRELFVSGLIMVAEVVSESSVRDDREEKPGIYATGRIPVFLVVDPIADPASVTVYSAPKDGQYTTSTTVTMGKEIHLPDPIDFTLDTAVFL